MDAYNVDLHIHSPHSIAVSKKLNLDSMVKTCELKGLNVVGTGDVLQPDWLAYLEDNLEVDQDGCFTYKDISFILQTEIEDNESIHEVVFFPDFDTVRQVQKALDPYSKNLMNEWGGRPRVDLEPEELTEKLNDLGCLVGPAHAFTPFKAIFRQKRFSTLEECYGSCTKHIHFLELGLSANTELADRLECLRDISFLSNSDAHSEHPRSLGREFNRIDMENPSFEELDLALRRKDGRKVILNVGLHPKLGKYYNMFCGKCRRRILFKKAKKKSASFLNQFSITENFVIYYAQDPEGSRQDYVQDVSQNKIICPACKSEHNKNYKVKLGVSERIEVISSYDETKNPSHRPKYINAVPLVDIIRAIKGIKSHNSKTVMKMYHDLIKTLGQEYNILLDLSVDEIKKYSPEAAEIISGFRNDEINYTPGGGGTYGQIKLDLE